MRDDSGNNFLLKFLSRASCEVVSEPEKPGESYHTTDILSLSGYKFNSSCDNNNKLGISELKFSMSP